MCSEEPTKGSDVNSDNLIAITVDDLSKEDWRELERELPDENLQRVKEKLACFQKMRSGTFKKCTAGVLPSPVVPTISQSSWNLTNISAIGSASNSTRNATNSIVRAINYSHRIAILFPEVSTPAELGTRHEVASI
uniref:Uncharacterized protein n=1 Tax=Oryza brachyantha TaxID=4533 RepID=J3N829_ORYBR